MNEENDIKFHDLNYTAERGILKKVQKHVLKGISGEFRACEMTAVMGPSGCGKSSLLNILSGFVTTNISGRLQLSGTQTRSYIMQEENLHVLLTVNESMMFAIHLKVGSRLKLKEKKMTVKRVLKDLGLDDKMETYVNNLSGGQQKRLSIALELLDDPTVMFLDEPTTGLDSSSSTQCIQLLKKLTQEGKTIVCTIHTPSARLFEMFDHLYAMADGRCIYQGRPGNLVGFLRDIDLPCPEHYNPSDFIVELANGDYGSHTQRLSERIQNGLVESYRCDNNNSLVTEDVKPVVQPTRISHVSSSFFNQLGYLTLRNFIILYRDKSIMWLRLVIHVFVSVIVGLVFTGTGGEASKILSTFKLIYGMTIFLMYTGFYSLIVRFNLDLSITQREHFNRWYSTFSYYIAMSLADAPLLTATTSIFVAILYILSDQPAEEFRFLSFLGVQLLMSFVSQGFAMMLGSIFTLMGSLLFGAIILPVIVLFGGIMITRKDANVYFHWLFDLCFVKYAGDSSTAAILGHNRSKLRCEDSLYCHFQQPAKFVETLGIDSTILFGTITKLFMFLILFRMIAYYMMRYRLKRMESLLKRIDSNNEKHLYSQLYKIRSEYIKNETAIELFRKQNGIAKLIDVLAPRIELDSSENDKIIEVILSTLGNCTNLSESSAFQAFDANIIEHAVNLVNNSGNASILSKSCRLIGNLAQFPKIAIALQEKGIALAMSNCLSEDANPVVLTMAIRAIRLMWNSKKFRTEILSFGSIFKIMLILYKLIKDPNEKAEEPEIESTFVILKRQHEPDRAISKEKLSHILEKLEKHQVEINYEISRPKKKNDDEFLMPTERESLELITGILKCLLSITAASLPQVSRSIFADGFGITCLMFLAGESSKFRSVALKIISNLSSNNPTQEYLTINNELITNVADLLLNSDELEKPLDINEKRNCINILCLSSENVCNRGKLRRSGVFKSLLSIANTSKCVQELSLLIFTFYQFRFDQLGLDNLLELGFINVMVKVLSDMIDDKDPDHIKFDDPSLDEERKEDHKSKHKKRSISDVPVGFNSCSKYMRYSPASPSGSSSGYTSGHQMSPSRSSGYSPFNSPSRSLMDCDDSDSDIYSPVCSENEEEIPKKEDFDILKFIYENDEIGAEEKIDLEDEEASILVGENEAEQNSQQESEKAESSKQVENIPETLKLIKANPIQYVLQLLWSVSIKKSDDPAFVKPTCLLTLHKVLKLAQRPNGKAFQILENILVKTRNFVPILKQDFIFKIRELSRPTVDHQNCYSCCNIKLASRDLLLAYGSVAESGYGRGEFAHFLLTGDEQMKRKIAVNLTYVISCPDILNDLLFRYKALDIVMDEIFNQGDLASEACDGLTVMSKNLNIRIPVDDESLHRIVPEDYEEDNDSLRSDCDQIKFILKNGETSFDKEALKQSSEVFSSMLSGSFRESNMNEINFPDYTIEGMKYFFKMVQLDREGKMKPIAPKINDMNVVLQAYELSILYIITNIQKPLLNVIKIVLDEQSVLKIFDWSLQHINHDLLISAICYFLCGDIDGSSKLKLFLEANQSQFKDEWRKLIIDTILMKCQPLL